MIEGNYSALLARRLERVTGVILLDASAAATISRYIRRTLGGRVRVGGLEGTRDRLSWEMIHFTLGPGQYGRRRNRALFDRLDLPKIRLPSRRALLTFYREEGLTRV